MARDGTIYLDFPVRCNLGMLADVLPLARWEGDTMSEALEKLVRGAMSGRFGENYIQVGEEAQVELARLSFQSNERNIALATLRAVLADRPSAHSDKVWRMVNDTIEFLESK